MTLIPVLASRTLLTPPTIYVLQIPPRRTRAARGRPWLCGALIQRALYTHRVQRIFSHNTHRALGIFRLPALSRWTGEHDVIPANHLLVQFAGLRGLILKILPVHFFCIQPALGLVRVGAQDVLGVLHQPLRCHPGQLCKRVVGLGVRVDANGSLTLRGVIPGCIAKVPPGDLAKKIICRCLLFQQGRVQRDAVATDGDVVELGNFFGNGGWLIDIVYANGFVRHIDNQDTHSALPGWKQQDITSNIDQELLMQQLRTQWDRGLMPKREPVFGRIWQGLKRQRKRDKIIAGKVVLAILEKNESVTLAHRGRPCDDETTTPQGNARHGLARANSAKVIGKAHIYILTQPQTDRWMSFALS